MKEDLISRQAAIEALDKLCDRCEYSKKQRFVMCGACHLGSAFDVIEELPSVSVAEKVGHWVFTEYRTWCCSECGGNPHKGTGFVPNKDGMKMRWKYCNLCGARMGEP